MYFATKIFKILLATTCLNMARQYLVRYCISGTMQKIHEDVLAKIMRAPINLFFDVTPTGSILNRFNGDMNHFEHLFHSMVHGSYQAMHLILILYSVSQASRTICFILPFLLAYSIYIYRFTCGSMREVHRVRSVIGSPCHNHWSETMSGNSTIRAFGTKKYAIEKDCEN